MKKPTKKSIKKNGERTHVDNHRTEKFVYPYPQNYEIENTDTAIKEKIKDAKELVKQHRIEFPNDKRKYVFSPILDKESKTGRVMFFVTLEGGITKEIEKKTIEAFSISTGGYKPVIL
jgi:hypothetical protein